MHCHHCNSLIKHKSISLGYGIREIGGKEQYICYECCAHFTKEDMRKDGKIALYLTQTKSTVHLKYQVQNWPGTLIFNVQKYKESTTNWGLPRVDVWFRFDGYWWWGKNINDSELLHCKRTKKKYS